MKIAIGIPCNRQFKPKTVEALLNIVAKSEHEILPLISLKGFTVAENRNWICAKAVQNQCDYLFLTDDDMILPDDILERLLAHDKDVIGAEYSIRRIIDPGQNHLVLEYLEGHKREADKIYQVKSMGGGTMLIKVPILWKLEQPLFGYDINDNGSVAMSNDWYFSRRVRDKGFEIWCDPTLEVKHIGDYEYEA